MQLAVIDSVRHVGPRSGAERAVATGGKTVERGTNAPGANAASGRGRAAAPVRGLLQAIDLDLNRRVAARQQGLQYLERAAQTLQELKRSLGSHLSGAPSGAAVATHLRSFTQLWHERRAATGGTLDERLQSVLPGEARTRFGVRGLTLGSLRTGESETLYLAVGGRTQHAVAVAVDPALSDAALVSRFARALAPQGLHVAPGAQGELEFSAPETAVSELRDVLAIKGEGRRFPTGQFTPVRISRAEPGIQPEQWRTDTPAQARETLRQVADAQAAIERARKTIRGELQVEGERAHQARTQHGAQPAWAGELVRSFEQTAARGDYATLAALSSSLMGMQRERVVALLSRPAL